MMKRKSFILCALLVAATMSFTACGNGNADNNNGTEAPYEDNTNKDVNESRNGTMGGDLEDAGDNLMDSIRDTGDAIRDGVDNLGNGTDNNNRTNP